MFSPLQHRSVAACNYFGPKKLEKTAEGVVGEVGARPEETSSRCQGGEDQGASKYRNRDAISDGTSSNVQGKAAK